MAEQALGTAAPSGLAVSAIVATATPAPPTRNAVSPTASMLMNRVPFGDGRRTTRLEPL